MAETGGKKFFCTPNFGLFGTMIDLGLDLEPLRDKIRECKLRYHREIWRIICDQGIQGGGWQKRGGDGEEGGEGGGEEGGEEANQSNVAKARTIGNRNESNSMTPPISGSVQQQPVAFQIHSASVLKQQQQQQQRQMQRQSQQQPQLWSQQQQEQQEQQQPQPQWSQQQPLWPHQQQTQWTQQQPPQWPQQQQQPQWLQQQQQQQLQWLQQQPQWPQQQQQPQQQILQPPNTDPSAVVPSNPKYLSHARAKMPSIRTKNISSMLVGGVLNGCGASCSSSTARLTSSAADDVTEYDFAELPALPDIDELSSRRSTTQLDEAKFVPLRCGDWSARKATVGGEKRRRHGKHRRP